MEWNNIEVAAAAVIDISSLFFPILSQLVYEWDKGAVFGGNPSGIKVVGDRIVGEYSFLRPIKFKSCWVTGRTEVFVQALTVTLFLFQLSVYTTTRSNIGTENNIDLVLNVENFDVESKFERYVFLVVL